MTFSLTVLFFYIYFLFVYLKSCLVMFGFVYKLIIKQRSDDDQMH